MHPQCASTLQASTLQATPVSQAAAACVRQCATSPLRRLDGSAFIEHPQQVSVMPATLTSHKWRQLSGADAARQCIDVRAGTLAFLLGRRAGGIDTRRSGQEILAGEPASMPVFACFMHGSSSYISPKSLVFTTAAAPPPAGPCLIKRVCVLMLGATGGLLPARSVQPAWLR